VIIFNTNTLLAATIKGNSPLKCAVSNYQHVSSVLFFCAV